MPPLKRNRGGFHNELDIIGMGRMSNSCWAILWDLLQPGKQLLVAFVHSKFCTWIILTRKEAQHNLQPSTRCILCFCATVISLAENLSRRVYLCLMIVDRNLTCEHIKSDEQALQNHRTGAAPHPAAGRAGGGLYRRTSAATSCSWRNKKDRDVSIDQYCSGYGYTT